MRVLHIIPSTFNYFDDIRSAAFSLVDNLQSLGVEADVFTLQYGAEGGTAEMEKSVEAAAPGRQYGGMIRMEEAITTFSNFDVVHMHVPFLGAAGKILSWKKNSATPLVVTCYRWVITPDFLSLFVKLYNWFYLPKFFQAADIVAVPSVAFFATGYGSLARRFQNKILEINGTTEFVDSEIVRRLQDENLTAAQRLALKYSLVYNELLPGAD